MLRISVIHRGKPHSGNEHFIQAETKPQCDAEHISYAKLKSSFNTEHFTQAMTKPCSDTVHSYYDEIRHAEKTPGQSV